MQNIEKQFNLTSLQAALDQDEMWESEKFKEEKRLYKIASRFKMFAMIGLGVMFVGLIILIATFFFENTNTTFISIGAGIVNIGMLGAVAGNALSSVINRKIGWKPSTYSSEKDRQHWLNTWGVALRPTICYLQIEDACHIAIVFDGYKPQMVATVDANNKILSNPKIQNLMK